MSFIQEWAQMAAVELSPAANNAAGMQGSGGGV